MVKREKRNKLIAGFEIFLLISMSFAIAFFLSENVRVSADAGDKYSLINGKFVKADSGTWTEQFDGSFVGPSGEQATMDSNSFAQIPPNPTGSSSPAAPAPAAATAPAPANPGTPPPATTPATKSSSGLSTILSGGSILGKGFTQQGVSTAVTGDKVWIGANQNLGPNVNGQWTNYYNSQTQTTQGIFKTTDGRTFLQNPTTGYMQQSSTTAFDAQHPISSVYGGRVGLGGVGGALVAGVAWAATAYLAVTMIGSMLGLDDGAQKALQYAALAGGFTYGTVNAVATNNVATTGVFSKAGIIGAHPLIAGLVVAAVVFILTYTSQRTEKVTYQCLPYEPPLGGVKCEECNKDSFRPCTEYRCKSLGQTCELLNKEDPAKALCANIGKFDVKSPTIQPWKEALSPQTLAYSTGNAIRPPFLGFKVISANETDGCLAPFTPLEFGITLDKPARCKIDYTRSNLSGQKGFDSMQFYFGGDNFYGYNHTQVMRLPAPNASGVDYSPLLNNGGDTTMYVKCMDGNGNVNEDDFEIRFCVSKSPDTTPPLIEGTSINSNSYIQYNVDKVPIEVYSNEPSECKWSRIDKDYKDMENPMTCATRTADVNPTLTYTCSANLTGITNTEDNTFYFRCRDQPEKNEEDRNTMSQSYKLILKGSQPLVILEAGPSGNIFGNSETVPVDLEIKTDKGALEGSAICSFSTTGSKDSWVQMFETNSFVSRQTLDLIGSARGTEYQYFFRCIDAGGNAAYTNTSFAVFVDKELPLVTRAYKEVPDALKIVTNEDAICAYSLISCNFNLDEGQKMQYLDPNVLYVHGAEWRENAVYYIKCKDKYENQPE